MQYPLRYEKKGLSNNSENGNEQFHQNFTFAQKVDLALCNTLASNCGLQQTGTEKVSGNIGLSVLELRILVVFLPFELDGPVQNYSIYGPPLQDFSWCSCLPVRPCLQMEAIHFSLVDQPYRFLLLSKNLHKLSISSHLLPLKL